MAYFKGRVLAEVIVKLLREEWASGNRNWVTDYRLKRLAQSKYGVVSREDSFRRAALDLFKGGRIRKFLGKSMYKCNG